MTSEWKGLPGEVLAWVIALRSKYTTTRAVSSIVWRVVSSLVWRSPRFRRLSLLFAGSVTSESFFDPLTWSLDLETEITHLMGLPWWLKENIPRVCNKCWPGVRLIHPSFREATTSDGVWWPCWESHFCGLRLTILWCMNLTRTLPSFPWDYFIASQKQRNATSSCETPHIGHTWWNIY